MPISDNEYMVSVSEGKISDLEHLFSRYHAGIYRYFYRKSNDYALSKDLTQSVFERILKYRSSFKNDCPFKAWIYKIAYNQYMDHFRVKRLQVEEYNNQVVADGKEENDVLNEQKLALHGAIAQLKDTEREIIQLTKIENLTIREVAEVMEMSESAIKVSVHRSIKKLRIIMNTNNHKWA